MRALLRGLGRPGAAPRPRLHATTAFPMSSPPPVLVASVYVSEGRDEALLSRLAAAVGPACVHTFADPVYHRTGFTLASTSPVVVASAALRLASALLESCVGDCGPDLRSHAGRHPRLGLLDHVSVHCLTGDGDDEGGGDEARLGDAGSLAHHIGATLARQHRLPVFFYGAASASGARLDDVRRRLGYFGAAGGEAAASPPPDAGPPAPRPGVGVACVGAVPFVVNYNVLLGRAEAAASAVPPAAGAPPLSVLAAARRVAAAASERRGGLAGCQALALPYTGGGGDGGGEDEDETVEVACNLLSPGLNGPAEVLAAVASAAAAEGLAVRRAYTTGLTRGELLRRGRGGGGSGGGEAAAAAAAAG